MAIEGFKFRGKEDGLPFQISKLDVSEETNEYEGYKIMTLSEVFKFYWRLKSIEGELIYPYTYNVSDGEGGFTEITEFLIPDSPDDLPQPRKRVCGEQLIEFSQADASDDSGVFSFVRVLTPTVHKIYNGDTSDDSNFLGYTIGEFGSGGYERAEDIEPFSDGVFYSGVVRTLDPFDEITKQEKSDVKIGGVSVFKVLYTNSANIGNSNLELPEFTFNFYE